MVENYSDNYYEKVIEENIGLVYYVANKYFYDYTEYHMEEFLQIGRIALYKAITTYDEDKAQFSTYATKVIKNAIYGYIITEKKKNRGVFDGYFLSLDKKYDEEGVNLIDTIEYYEEDYNSIMICNEILEYIYNKKDEQMIAIIEMLKKGYTYNEIGLKLDISRQRVCQVVKKIRKIIVNRFGLESYMIK